MESVIGSARMVTWNDHDNFEGFIIGISVAVISIHFIYFAYFDRSNNKFSEDVMTALRY